MFRLLCGAGMGACAVAVLHAEPVQEPEIWRVYVDDAAPSREALSVLERLRNDARFAHVTWEVVRLGDATKDPVLRRNAALAMRDMVSYAPSFVLQDGGGMYACVVGATAACDGKSLEDRLLEGSRLRSVDRSALQSQLEVAAYGAELFLLMGEAADIPADADVRVLSGMIGKAERFCTSLKRPVALRQAAVLRLLYPLLLRKTAALYANGHSPRTEAAFNAAVAALEYARDLDRKSPDGQRAHTLREELRRARLQAKACD